MSVSIQPISWETYPDYLDLMKSWTSYDYPAISKELFDERTKDTKIVGYFCNGELIAAGSLYFLQKLHNHPIGQIEDVIVKESYRGKGIGKQLVLWLHDYAFRQGVYKVILNCIPKNEIFYEKCGFVKTGAQMTSRNAIVLEPFTPFV